MSNDQSTILISRPDLTDANAHDVLRSAWFDYVTADPTMELVESVQGRNPRTGATFIVKWPGTAIWQQHPNAANGILPRFVLLEFNIEVLDADEFTLAKTHEIATAIDGTVTVL